jgi:transposase InsO family protein
VGWAADQPARRLAGAEAPRAKTRRRRLSLVAGYAAVYERKPALPEPERHIEASRPGELVGLDCFYVGRLSGTKGTVWQYTAIDVASSYAWAELHTSPRNPLAKHCSALVDRVASELAQAGWRLENVITDNGSEFRSHELTSHLDRLGVRQRRIRAGRPTSNGHVERLQLTILEECWRPSFSRSLVPKLTALQRDLVEYLTYYNFDRAHTGRLTKGRVPAGIVYAAPKNASHEMSNRRYISGSGQPSRARRTAAGSTRAPARRVTPRPTRGEVAVGRER